MSLLFVLLIVIVQLVSVSALYFNVSYHLPSYARQYCLSKEPVTVAEFVDVNGDSRPDLVWSMNCQNSNYNGPVANEIFMNNGCGFVNQTDFNTNGYCATPNPKVQTSTTSTQTSTLEVLSLETLALYLDVSVKDAASLLASGEIPSRKIGSAVRVSRAAVDRWLAHF